MKRTISLTTPEGVPLELQTGELGDRLLAWLLDMFLIIAIVLLSALALMPLPGDVSIPLLIVLGFVLRNFWFPLHELRSGRTPGKRARNLQVVALDGGPLTPGMIVARNVTRELETTAPLTLMFGGMDLDGPSAGASALAMVWLLVLVAIPFLSRRRARLGDLLAGTAVVQIAPAILLHDLSAESARPTERDRVVFTTDQLAIYGIAELHVLEDLLRRTPDEPRAQAIALVAEKVRAKIGWRGPTGDDERFLRAFYDAQRSRLEHDLAHGRRRERKGG